MNDVVDLLSYRLRERINELKKELKEKEEQLRLIEKNCHHKWPNIPEYIPEYQAGYTIPGDPPGTMGVDRRGPTYVPAKTVKRWRRVCSLCGKVEITEDSITKGTELPNFG